MVSVRNARFVAVWGVLTAMSGVTFAETFDQKVWWTDYGAAYRLAEKEGKPLLVVFEKADLQDPQFLAAVGLDSVSSLLEHYILCRIDGTTKEGRDLAQKFHTPGLPSLVITDKQLRRVAYRRQGPLSDVDWAVMLVSYRADEPPAERPQESKSRRAGCYT